MATQEETAPGAVSGLERGTRVLVECVAAPVYNRKEGILFVEAGEKIAVVLSGFWEGMLERGVLKLVEVLEALPPDPERPAEKRRPNNHKPLCRCFVCKRVDAAEAAAAAKVGGDNDAQSATAADAEDAPGHGGD